jgi:hypothetical protein
MPKLRSPYNEPVIVPWLDHRTVNPGQVVGVTDAQLPGFLASGWEPADAETKKAAAALSAQAETQTDAGVQNQEG